MRPALVVALLAGCGASADPNAAALVDVEAATRALDRAVGLQTAFITTGNIDVGATPDIIAAALLGRVQSEAAGCVSATRTGATVHADFGAGCALATASMHAGGTVDIQVQNAPTGGISALFTLAASVDSEALGGTFTVSTPNGNAFSYDGTVTLGRTTVSAPLLHAGIAAGAATLDATSATANSKALTLAAVHQRFAGCYAEDGTATLDTLGVTFASDTPQTGVVTLSTGKSDTLPVRPGCPR